MKTNCYHTSSCKQISRIIVTENNSHCTYQTKSRVPTLTQLIQMQKHINWTTTNRTTEFSVVHFFSTWTTKTAVASRCQCSAWILRRHETHLAVVDRSGHVGVHGCWHRRHVDLLLLDVRFFVIAWTAVGGRATHVVGVWRDVVANSLQELQTCVSMGVVPLQTHLYVHVIEILQTCPPTNSTPAFSSPTILTVPHFTQRTHIHITCVYCFTLWCLTIYADTIGLRHHPLWQLPNILNHTARLAVHTCYTISAWLKLRFVTSKSAVITIIHNNNITLWWRWT